MRRISLVFLIFCLFFNGSFLYVIADEGKRDINKATMEELMSVKGIGKKRAEKILEYIRENRGISDMDELLSIKGIGERTLEELKKEFGVKKQSKPQG